MAKRICSIPDCASQHWARGWCQMHYGRWRRHGDPLKSLRFAHPVERFLQYVEITETCWLWTGYVNDKGYAQFNSLEPGTGTSAHRFAYANIVGEIAAGLEIDHTCRVRRCVNPDHLEAVTHAENMRRAEAAIGADNYNGAKTHCPQGHEYAGLNLRESNGRRYCRTCQIANARDWRRRRNAA